MARPDTGDLQLSMDHEQRIRLVQIASISDSKIRLVIPNREFGMGFTTSLHIATRSIYRVGRMARLKAIQSICEVTVSMICQRFISATTYQPKTETARTMTAIFGCGMRSAFMLQAKTVGGSWSRPTTPAIRALSPIPMMSSMLMRLIFTGMPTANRIPYKSCSITATVGLRLRGVKLAFRWLRLRASKM